jgi:protocatechuate 3,4-dioxygenase beta subunit
MRRCPVSPSTSGTAGGIAKTNGDGTAWFRPIFPACYSGRRPHIHFEFYASVAKAVSNEPSIGV